MTASQPTVTNPGWTTDGLAGSRFGPVTPADEFLHAIAPDGGYASTETSYWGFCVPERNLMAEIYLWFHPALRTMSAGILLWRGMRRTSLESEYVHGTPACATVTVWPATVSRPLRGVPAVFAATEK